MGPRTRFGLAIAFTSIVFTALALAAGAATAGTLRVYEAAAGAGRIRVIVGAVNNALIDIDYAPISAEGGKLYGISEFEIEATGNLVLSPTGFACQAVPCLFSPSPFVTGKRIRVTAGNDLAGSTAATANLLTIGLTGNTGFVVLTRGEYLDGTGPGASVGAVRTPDVTLIVSVPEPGIATALAFGCGLLALATRARASSRSGSAPASRAPRGR
ncbi:MAG: hypothetical protein IPK00_20815 [Deltaproteobacteria bacterium]|nr:hypothetical protein [Deltaproteobacteria bacterium]